jgi:hypothetical protein
VTGMTNTITVRLRRSKSEIQARAKPNINAWINDLIEQALGPKQINWSSHFDRLREGRFESYVSDELRQTRR